MSNGKANAFFKAARAAGALIFTGGFGDSRFMRNGHGVMYGAHVALAEAAGGSKGLMSPSNVHSPGLPHIGMNRCGRRSYSYTNSAGFQKSRPTGTTGIQRHDRCILDTATLSGSLTDSSTSGSTIPVTGDVSGWPTADFYVNVDLETIRVKSRSSNTLTLFSTGDGFGYTSGFGRGELATKAGAHSSGATISLCGPNGASWWGPGHQYELGSTVATAGALSGTGTGTFTIQAGDADGWPTAAHNLLIGSEYITCTRSGTTMTITARGVYGSTPATHAVNDPVGILDEGVVASIQVHSRSAIGNACGLTYGCLVESIGSVSAIARIKPAIYGAANMGEDATSAQSPALSATTSVNPTWSDPAGTVGGAFVTCPPTTSGSRTAQGVSAGTEIAGGSVGPFLKTWQYLGASGGRGGLVQCMGFAQGGYSLWNHIAGLTRTPGAQASMVRMFQAMRVFSGAKCGNNGKVRHVQFVDCCHNDAIETRLSWATVGQAWTIQYTAKVATSINGSATSLDLDDASNFPTSGHAINQATGERFSWTGKSGNTLTGLARGDFSSTAASMSAGQDISIGYQSREAAGPAANALFLHRFVAALWNLSDVHAANASYPIATSGSLSILSPLTGVPDSATEFMTLLVRPMAVWNTSSVAAPGSDPTTSWSLREGRFDAYMAAAKTNFSGLTDLIDFVDLGRNIIGGDEHASGNYCDVQAVSTISASVDSTQTTVPVTSVSGWATTGGYVWIDSECIRYSAISGSTLTGCVRGVGNTTAAAHSNGAAIALMELVHSSASGFVEAWTRWASKNVSGAGGTGGLSINLAATIKVGTPVAV